MRVALVHDWLVTQRGGENVLLELCRLFPAATVHTLVHAHGRVHPDIEAHPIVTSFVQHLPGAPAHFRQYLGLFPAAIERFDLRGFDLVFSTSHCVAKGVRTGVGQLHVSYVHTPMRYIWDQMPEYLARLPAAALLSPLARLAARALRRWDVASAARPQVLLANSEFVRERIAKVWRRDATVVYPPVDVDFYAAASPVERHGYLVVSALVPYKRVELAVQWATRTGSELTVVGDGGELARLRHEAGPSVSFARDFGPTELRLAYARAEALLFCGVEDFGIVPVEAQAAGCPVVALGRGGALETVVGQGERATGVTFAEPSVEALSAAIDALTARRTRGDFSRAALLAQARRFDRATFVREIRRILVEQGVDA